MAGPLTFTLLCGLLAVTLAETTLRPPAVLSLGREVIKERLTQELKDHDAVNILQQLPLLSTIREKPAGGIPILGNLVNSILNHIIWLKVTSANILQLLVQPSDEGQGLAVKIPLDMVAGLNTPLVKTIVEMHMQTEVQAIITVNASERGHTHLVLEDCSNSHGSLRISLLQKLSFLVNSLANKVMSLLVPALPKLVKTQLCPVIKEAFKDMHVDLLSLVRAAPISLGSNHLEFDPLSPAIKGNVIQLKLGAKLVNSQGNVTKWFKESAVSLTVPALDNTPFSLTVRQDVVNAAVAALLPQEELVVLLDYVLPELARQLKSSIKVISTKAADQLGPTQMVKILTQETPDLLLDQGTAKVAQLIVLEVFATNEAHRPFFTLGIEASSEAQFYTRDDRLMLSFNEISSDRIHLMNSGIGLFNPELLKNVTTEILNSVLLPNQNGKLRSGISIPMVKALGFEEASSFLTKDSLVITPASQ
ncbi:BPI fold-containing family B member 1 isoform X1 [Panthera leo]|uniref:BPI fold-containing family B member 1 isoform X1 n=1 Tax=Panthera leo TaxID=9689 RepID=UPI001C69A332|nr:BPI fold-containing family B member 1 isoform X1 [Panthera leo]XP_042787174.1 BPI fold-containing family B member 1 isoform X1 [Panthera leo]